MKHIAISILIIYILLSTPLNSFSIDFSNECYTTPTNGYYYSYGGQCTAFAWGRACENNDIHLRFNTVSLPSAKYWYLYEPIDSLNLTLGTTVQSNSIAVWEGDATNNPDGHVAYVEKVESGIVYFNEANVETYCGSNCDWWGGGYDGYEKTLTIDQFEHRGGWIGDILGYIYLNDSCIEGYGAAANTPSTFDDYTVNLGMKNNCASSITIQDIAISFHDKDTRACVQKCYRRGSGYELAPGESVITGTQHCNMDPDTDIDPCSNIPLVPGEYLLVYKLNINGEWKDVAERTVEVIEESVGTKHPNITPIISLLLSAPKSQTTPSVATGIIEGWRADTSFYFDNHTDITTNIETQWSLNQFSPDRGYFYGYNSSTEVAHLPEITDICEISDASAYTYDAWSVGPVDEGDFILLHNITTDFYGAFRVDNIYGSWQTPLLDLTWYLQEDGSSSFNNCSSN